MLKNNYLITGGLGLIGSNISKQLVRKKNVGKCILVDNYAGYINPLRRHFRDFRKYRFDDLQDKKVSNSIKKKYVFERGDVSDFKTMVYLIEKYKPKVIFHTAAVPVSKVQNPNISEFRKGSLDTTINILDCVDFLQRRKSFKLDRFLYISSSMVYGNFKKKKALENDNTNPIEIYGTLKLAGEVITKGVSNSYSIPYTIIRPSAVYGPTDMNERVTQYFLNKSSQAEPIQIHGKDEKLDFTFINDIADGIIKAATNKNGINNTFNITYGKSRTLLDYVLELKKYYKNIQFEIIKRDSTRPKRGTLSISKAKKLLNYKPKYNLKKGVREYVYFNNKNF